ncbi:tyrosine-type recombinase/integrase [Thalassomonas actiniarum]|uniref:Tyrosine-type recombinase/integrase n=1 Tax=Thalassomonas actiniarum TaxID=485447 RepID=A0AAF0C690_9GAMM|nr:tyrosine-type recombinase/integrase [Thalassomonas actiniarum]WDE02368.1 tyrosine-type recombinase/integrase [Thalassomonas actiniarum]
MSSVISREQNHQHQPLMVQVERKLNDVASFQYLLSLESKQSRETMSSHLNNVARLFGVADHAMFRWELLDSDIVYYIRGRFQTLGLSPATINTILCAVRQTVKHAFMKKQISHENYDRIKLVKNLKASKVVANRVLSSEEIRNFLSACDDNSFAGLRDATLFLTMIACGLRRAEAVAINIEQIDFNQREIIITGKGSKERRVWYSELTADYLREYLQELRGNEAGALFVRMNKYDDPVLSSKKSLQSVPGMTPPAVNYILKNRGLLGNIDGFKPHDLRRTFATKQLSSGTDIKTVSKLLGHASIATTQIYDLRDDDVAKKAAREHQIF